jgi:hypothetical protein
MQACLRAKCSNGSIERTFQRPLRGLCPTTHVERLGLKSMRLYSFLRIMITAFVASAYAPSSAAEPVPNTLAEAFSVLDKQLPAKDRESFKRMPERNAVTDAHRGLGMYIRNEWFRAGHSALPSSLQARHLDDASSIVLTSYWRYLNGKPLDVERQVSCYHRWWDEQQRIVNTAKAKGSSSYGMLAFSCPEG